MQEKRAPPIASGDLILRMRGSRFSDYSLVIYSFLFKSLLDSQEKLPLTVLLFKMLFMVEYACLSYRILQVQNKCKLVKYAKNLEKTQKNK